MSKQVQVFLTVDTEHSIGGAFRDPALKPVGNDRRIFYKVGKKDYGIPMIMDIAEAHNFCVTFFLEVLNKYYFGENETKAICRYIIGRGHDVQLHLHPNFLNFRTNQPSQRQFLDSIYKYPLEMQIKLTRDGKEMLAKYGASSIIAFRAGNFGADRNTLIALRKNGFTVDSSYSRAFLKRGCMINVKDLNDARKIEGIWEIPITNFREKSSLSNRKYRPFDINGASYYQIKNAMEKMKEKGAKTITIILHSFSFIEPLDLQYHNIRIRGGVIRRFEKLCQFLSNNRHEYIVQSLGDIKEESLKRFDMNPNYFPEVGAHLSLHRLFEQVMDRVRLAKKQRYSGI